MTTRALIRLAVLAWLGACLMLCVLAFDPMRSEAARVAVLSCAIGDIVAALILTGMADRRVAHEAHTIDAINLRLDAMLQIACETRSVPLHTLARSLIG